MFKCPVCGKYTISFRQKWKMYYKLKITIVCNNCDSKLTESNLAALVYLLTVFIIAFILHSKLYLVLKVITSLVLYFIARCIVKLYVPIVECKE